MKKHKFLKIIVAIILLILLANVGYYFFAKWQESVSLRNATPLGHANSLKTYTNPALGFELKYPSSWTLKENENTVEINPPSNGNVTYFSASLRNEFKSLDEVKLKLASSVPITPVQVDTASGFEYDDGISFQAIWLMHGDKIYIVRKYFSASNGDDGASQIFSTLKFLD